MKKLIFVYNADGDFVSSVKDALHKILKPKTYECNLCAITYGPLTMKKSWKDFIATLEIKSEFLHHDELVKQYPDKKDTKLPAVFLQEDNNLKLLITAAEINSCKTMMELKELVKNKL